MDSISFAAFGFVVGIAATLIMTLLEIPFWKKWGLQGVLEWHENQILSSKLLKSNPNKLNFYGIFLLHFLNGALGGLGFSVFLLIFPVLLQYVYILGIGYGLFLWILTLLPIHKPITGINPFRHPDGFGPVFVSFIGHVTYGLLLSCILSYYI